MGQCKSCIESIPLIGRAFKPCGIGMSYLDEATLYEDSCHSEMLKLYEMAVFHKRTVSFAPVGFSPPPSPCIPITDIVSPKTKMKSIIRISTVGKLDSQSRS
eukprot:Tbor_TRINITY_DN5858_c5_g4::TRINITY_DN5858_c5_g4_i1::g.6802::m.6802